MAAMLSNSAAWFLIKVLLASLVTSTIQSARNAEEDVYIGPEEQQENEFAENTTTSRNTSNMNTEREAVDIYLQQNVSENYITYLIEHKNLLDEATFSPTDIQEIKLLVANESVVVRNIPIENLLDSLENSKSVVMSFRTPNNFTKYTVQTETPNHMSNVLVETAGSTSLSIVLILLNETVDATQEVNTFLDHLNNTLKKNHILVDTRVLLPNKTKTTHFVLKPEQMWRKSKQYYILTHYIDPAVYGIILVVGLLGNGLLLFIFIRHREMRTVANLMIINLAVCDIVNLSVNAPLHFYFQYEGGSQESLLTCRVVLVLRQYLRFTGALAVITLILQRFSIIIPAFRQSTSKHFTVLSIITVWLLPLPIAWPTMFVPEFYGPICSHGKEDRRLSYVIVLNLVLYCVIMPSLMFWFSSRIARRLNHSVKHMPGEVRHQMQEESRIRSARMMMALAVVFVFTYFPFHVWILLVRWVGVNKDASIMIYALHFTKQVLFANGCFNPIAMFVVSSAFRKLLARHVTYSSDKGVYCTRL